MNAELVLVTGATGFLGQEIVRHIGANYAIFATGRRPRAELRVDYAPVDLLEGDLDGSLPDSIDTIIHAAGLTSFSEQVFAQNLEMTRRVIDWGIKVGARNLILISSAAVYAHSIAAHRESSECNPQSSYGISKLKSERYAIRACADADIQLVILRKPALVGSTWKGNVAGLIRALKRSRFVLVGNGSNQKSLIAVSDAARACLATLEYLKAGRLGTSHRVFNVSGGAMSMMEIIDVICEELGRGRPLRVPAGLATGPLKALSTVTLRASAFDRLLVTVEQFLRNDVLDASSFGEHVGFKPKMQIGQALKEMVQYQN